MKFNPADFEIITKIAREFPGTEPSVSHNDTPSVKVNGKLLARLHENGKWIPIHVGFDARDELKERHPDLFEIPEHFTKYPYIVMLVQQRYDVGLLKHVLESAWKRLALKRQLAEYQNRK